MPLSKMKKGPGLNGDRISDMPSSIIENILSRLPIDEAVRTCILSKKWRYNWVTLPELVFDNSLGSDLIIHSEKLVKFIDGVLSLHRGPICKFKLSDLYISSSTDLGKWILCVSRKGILELIFCPEHQFMKYDLPSCLYSCEQLNHLELKICTLRRPPLFATFKFLKSLLLDAVDFDGFTFENLVSRCPQLERLEIKWFTGSTDLIIYAPNLKNLAVHGFCNFTQIICFKNTPLIVSVSLDLLCRRFSFNPRLLNHKLGDTDNSRLMKVFGCLGGVEKLAVRGNFLKFLALDIVPEKLPNAYYNMKRLNLEICFHDSHMISMALCLIRSAPNLQELKIDAVTHTYTGTEFSEVRDGPEFSLNQLQNIIITYFSGQRPQLEFIEFLLSISPVLEKMSIHIFAYMNSKFQTINGPKMLEELMRFPRVSPEAKIEYFESGKLVELGNEEEEEE